MQESNTKKILWIVLASLSTLIIALVIAIVIVVNRPKELPVTDDTNVAQGVEAAYNVNDAAYDIVYKYENDPDYSLGNAEQAFGELIDGAVKNGRIYATVTYANFLYDQTRDIERAVTLMETIEEEVPDDLKAGFYISFSNLYEKAGMDAEAEQYYTLATQLYKEYGNL